MMRASLTEIALNLDARSPLTMNNRVPIPRLGLGVFRAGSGGATRDAVRAALEVGYRHIDTAHIYGNEVEVGEGVRMSGVPRSEIFVTTKLWNDDHGYDRTRVAFDRSLKALGIDYVDLYLVHFPVPGNRLATWRAMESILAEGRARSIGVSNYMPQHIEELLGTATVPPAVNQIEIHPFLQQRAAVKRCEEANIAIEAYSPLTRGQKLEDPRLRSIASRVKRTPAQVLIRWSLQKNYVVLPKSSSPKRIAENAEALNFELDDDMMAALDSFEDGTRIAWDPTHVA